MKYIVSFFFASSIFLFSCSNFTDGESEEFIISYNGQFLELGDIESVQPSGLTKDDSIVWVEQFKEDWLKNQIIIAKAEKELSRQEANIALELLQYKADLLKYKFEKHYIKNKINTQVSKSEIEAYYEENKNALITIKTIVKATYIEIPNSVKDRYKVKQWLISGKEKDEDKLKTYCFQNATVFDDFEGNWVELKNLRLMSQSDKLRDGKVVENKVIEQKNDSLTHYILINKIITQGSIMPLDYAKDEIVKIIIRKRKHQLLNELNQKISLEAAKQLENK